MPEPVEPESDAAGSVPQGEQVAGDEEVVEEAPAETEQTTEWTESATSEPARQELGSEETASSDSATVPKGSLPPSSLPPAKRFTALQTGVAVPVPVRQQTPVTTATTSQLGRQTASIRPLTQLPVSAGPSGFQGGAHLQTDESAVAAETDAGNLSVSSAPTSTTPAVSGIPQRGVQLRRRPTLPPTGTTTATTTTPAAQAPAARTETQIPRPLQPAPQAAETPSTSDIPPAPIPTLLSARQGPAIRPGEKRAAPPAHSPPQQIQVTPYQSRLQAAGADETETASAGDGASAGGLTRGIAVPSVKRRRDEVPAESSASAADPQQDIGDVAMATDQPDDLSLTAGAHDSAIRGGIRFSPEKFMHFTVSR